MAERNRQILRLSQIQFGDCFKKQERQQARNEKALLSPQSQGRARNVKIQSTMMKIRKENELLKQMRTEQISPQLDVYQPIDCVPTNMKNFDFKTQLPSILKERGLIQKKRLNLMSPQHEVRNKLLSRSQMGNHHPRFDRSRQIKSRINAGTAMKPQSPQITIPSIVDSTGPTQQMSFMMNTESNQRSDDQARPRDQKIFQDYRLIDQAYLEAENAKTRNVKQVDRRWHLTSDQPLQMKLKAKEVEESRFGDANPIQNSDEETMTGNGEIENIRYHSQLSTTNNCSNLKLQRLKLNESVNFQGPEGAKFHTLKANSPINMEVPRRSMEQGRYELESKINLNKLNLIKDHGKAKLQKFSGQMKHLELNPLFGAGHPRHSKNSTLFSPQVIKRTKKNKKRTAAESSPRESQVHKSNINTSGSMADPTVQMNSRLQIKSPNKENRRLRMSTIQPPGQLENIKNKVNLSLDLKKLEQKQVRNRQQERLLTSSFGSQHTIPNQISFSLEDMDKAYKTANIFDKCNESKLRYPQPAIVLDDDIPFITQNEVCREILKNESLQSRRSPRIDHKKQINDSFQINLDLGTQYTQRTNSSRRTETSQLSKLHRSRDMPNLSNKLHNFRTITDEINMSTVTSKHSMVGSGSVRPTADLTMAKMRDMTQKQISNQIQQDLLSYSNLEQSINDALTLTDDDYDTDPIEQFQFLQNQAEFMRQQQNQLSDQGNDADDGSFGYGFQRQNNIKKLMPKKVKYSERAQLFKWSQKEEKTLLESKKRKVSQLPKEELRSLIQTLEKFMIQLNQDPQQLAYLKSLDHYEVNPEDLHKERKGQFQAIKRDIEASASTQVSIIGKKLKNKVIEEQQKQCALIEMKAILDDQEFQYQLQKAKPGTKELLNCIIMEATKNKLSHQIYQQRKVKVGTRSYSLLASSLLEDLKIAYNKLVKIQMTKERKQQVSDISLYNIFMSSNRQPEVDDANGRESGKPVRKRIQFGPAVEKFRRLVAQNFLSMSLEQLEEVDFNQLNVVQILNLSKLNHSLINLFEDNKAKQSVMEFHNIGRRYEIMNKNVFYNEYLRDFVSKKPRFGEHFRIPTKEYFNRSENWDEVTLDHSKFDELEKIFNLQLGKSDFFKVAKDQKLTMKNSKDMDMHGLIDYFELCRRLDPLKTIDPSLILINEGSYCLFNRSISIEQSIAIREYLLISKDMRKRQIKDLVIDSCQMEDEAMANILEGVASHVSRGLEKGQLEVLHHELKGLTLSNVVFGRKSFEKIKLLQDDLIEIKLCSLKMKDNFRQSLLNQFVTDLTERSVNIMKLSICNMNINNRGLCEDLVSMLQMKPYLQYIDISSCYLNPANLKLICGQITEMAKQLRDVNVSYNQLDFSDEGSQDYKDSEGVLQHFETLFANGQILNHFNASGMNLTQEKITRLCQAVIKNNIIMSVHLNDNGITSDFNFMLEILDIFGIGQADLPPERLVHDDENPKPEVGMPLKLDSFDQKLDIRPHIQKYMNLREQGLQEEILVENQEGGDSPKSVHNCERKVQPEALNKERRKQKDRIFMAKELKNVQRLRRVMNLKNYNAVHLAMKGSVDNFTLTRILNHPELVFNQNPQHDNDRQRRWFKTDAQHTWTLSRTHECLICDRYAYTMIFYERGTLAANVGLTEIEDPEILKMIKYDYAKNYVDIRSSTPIICGTVISKQFGQPQFQRKLKMLRTPIFSLLSLCQQEDFCWKEEVTQQIKEGVLQFLKVDGHLEKVQAERFLRGWPRILEDLAGDNQLTDVRAFNFPNLKVTTVEKQDWFTFAGFLPAGYHQVVIYDPQLERAFCKDMVVRQNDRDFVYPEYPVPTGNLKQKVVQNMWRKFVETTRSDHQKIFQLEQDPGEFQIENYIKNKDDIIDTTQYLLDQFETILTYQKLLMIQSNKFPQISWDSVNESIVKVQRDPAFDQRRAIIRSKVELCFISATSGDDTHGLRSAMQRCELLDFLVRFAKTMVYQYYGPKAQIATHLPEFFRTYIHPVIKDSTLLPHRKQIRGSRRLNELLFDNYKGLHQIYEYVKTLGGARDPFDGRCSRLATELYFSCFRGPGQLKLGKRIIHECFIYSQMTIKNEHRNIAKYNYLDYVEFQEMVCRVAVRGNPAFEPVEWKVYVLLDLMWEKHYEAGIWQPEIMPLAKVNQTVFQ